MQGWMMRVKRALAGWSDQKWTCAHCGRRVEAQEFTCDEDECRIGAMEAQAMLAPVHAWPPLFKELEVLWSAPALRDGWGRDAV